MRFAIQDHLVTAQNLGAVQDFARLAKLSAQRKLKPAEAKRFARLQTQLMRTGVVTPVTRELLEKQARALYESLPWWRKFAMRVHYRVRYWATRVEAYWLQLESKRK